MIKWDYRITQLSIEKELAAQNGEADDSIRSFSSRLAAMGDEGWEAFATIHNSNTGHDYLLYRRPRPWQEAVPKQAPIVTGPTPALGPIVSEPKP